MSKFKLVNGSIVETKDGVDAEEYETMSAVEAAQVTVLRAAIASLLASLSDKSAWKHPTTVVAAASSAGLLALLTLLTDIL